MSSQVYIKIGGESVEIIKDWIHRREKVHEDRKEFSKEIGSDCLYTMDNDRFVVGWVGEDDEPYLRRCNNAVRHEGKTVKIIKPNKRFKLGKEMSARMKKLTMPSHEEIFNAVGVPHHYICDGQLWTPGLSQVGGDWFATGIHSGALDESLLADGCEVLKDWEFLKLKDSEDS